MKSTFDSGRERTLVAQSRVPQMNDDQEFDWVDKLNDMTSSDVYEEE